MRVAPVIETERLLLRPHRADDLDARTRLYADGEALRFIGGAQSREESWARIQRYAGHWALLGWGLWAVEHRSAGYVGEVGLARFERGLGDGFDGAPEAAWVIDARQAGQGLAEEAMKAAIDWHDSSFGPMRMVCVIAHENAASLRVAEKLGFKRFAEREYKGAPRLLLERVPDGDRP